jgi:hypothetical protein
MTVNRLSFRCRRTRAHAVQAVFPISYSQFRPSLALKRLAVQLRYARHPTTSHTALLASHASHSGFPLLFGKTLRRDLRRGNEQFSRPVPSTTKSVLGSEALFLVQPRWYWPPWDRLPSIPHWRSGYLQRNHPRGCSGFLNQISFAAVAQIESPGSP